MNEDSKSPNMSVEDESLKMTQLLKAYNLSQKILGDFYELTCISGLMAQGCLVYLNEISKVDLKTRVTVQDNEDK